MSKRGLPRKENEWGRRMLMEYRLSGQDTPQRIRYCMTG